MTSKILRSGHVVEEASEEETKHYLTLFPLLDGIVRLNPGKWFYPSTIPRIINRIHELEFRSTDILVLTQPKSGTTWTQEILWTLVHNPNLDNPEATHSIDIRSPHLEINMLLDNKKVPKLDQNSESIKYLKSTGLKLDSDMNLAVSLLKTMKGSRIMKSHLPLSLLPKSALENAQIVYMARDPRDVIVSKFHFFRQWLTHSFSGTLSEFLELFLKEKQFHQPYWPHVKEAYDERNRPNVLFLYFEDLKESPAREISKIAKLLNLNRTPQQIENVVTHTAFINMKKRSKDGNEPMSDGGRYIRKLEDNTGFFRAGKSGTWKDEFTPEQVAQITKWMEENMKEFPDDFKYKHKE